MGGLHEADKCRRIKLPMHFLCLDKQQVQYMAGNGLNYCAEVGAETCAGCDDVGRDCTVLASCQQLASLGCTQVGARPTDRRFGDGSPGWVVADYSPTSCNQWMISRIFIN